MSREITLQIGRLPTISGELTGLHRHGDIELSAGFYTEFFDWGGVGHSKGGGGGVFVYPPPNGGIW